MAFLRNHQMFLQVFSKKVCFCCILGCFAEKKLPQMSQQEGSVQICEICGRISQREGSVQICEICGRKSQQEGCVGMAGMPYPPKVSPFR